MGTRASKPLDAAGLTATIDEPTTLITGVTEVITGTDIDWHGRVSTVTTSEGIMLLINSSFDKHISTKGGNHLRFSDDYGATWTAQDTTLADDAVVTQYTNGEPYIFELPNGNLCITLARAWGASADGTYQTISSDGGLTWSEPTKIALAGLEEDINYLALIDDSFIYNDVIYLAGRISDNGSESGVRSILTKSTDNGATWELVSVINVGTNEVGMEFCNGKIICILRDATLTQTYRAISGNMGATWQVESIYRFFQVSGKHRMYTGRKLRGEANWWNDSVMICTGFQSTPNRRPAVWLSNDYGMNWSQAQPIVTDYYGDGGYGDLSYDPVNGKYIALNYIGASFDVADVIQAKFTIAEED